MDKVREGEKKKIFFFKQGNWNLQCELSQENTRLLAGIDDFSIKLSYFCSELKVFMETI